MRRRRPMRRRRSALLVVLTLVCLQLCPGHSSGLSWNIFSSSPPSPTTPTSTELDDPVTEFSMNSNNNNPRGLKLLENAQNKLAGPKNCWQEAYGKLFASCSKIMADKELQSRLAWHLSSCFQEDSGQPPFPSCAEASKTAHCLKRLGDSEHKVFLEFFLETNTLCHQLQAEAFKDNTERLVNGLSRSSRSAVEKLEEIGERSEQIITESGKVQDTLNFVKTQADRLAETSKNVQGLVDDVLVHSRAIFDQSREILVSQAELRGGQTEMKEKIDAGMERIQESYEKLWNGMDKLKEKAVDIQREIRSVGDSLSSKMEDLQDAADRIGSVAGKPLENQMQLLEGQSKAMAGLNSLYSFQSKALEESRETMQKLAQFGQRQQEELLSKQEQIRRAHEHLIENSHSILDAQEEFRAKQANIFAALDKLYILHNAILAESRFIKAFFFYCCIVLLIYMLTSAKQTFRIWGQLYFGLCITFLLEMGLIRIGSGDFDDQFRVLSKVFLVRSTFLAAATIQTLHSIFTFRDYELLNHRLLQTLVEKVRTLEENKGERMLSYSGSEESLRNYSWVFDELMDEADSKGDPNYVLPAEVVGENFITTSVSRGYNLRPRSRR